MNMRRSFINKGRVKLLQRRIGRKKSRFEKIKALKYTDSKSGMKEINYIYG